uniref:THAP-type domain-containing protein n=1 Tax=Neogobius melanostomus TaxID=47308 RepID=A0A8C6S8H5_9GOBI
MVKCVVSSCLNREQLGADRGCSRAPKRFFSFPKDPARVKVWLAALREPDKRDNAENHVICEDHFLPEDVSDSGVNPDAIPIMPPCLEEELGLDAWPEDPEEDDSWAMGDEDQEEDIDEAPEEEVDEDEVDEDEVEDDEEVDDEVVDEAVDENKAEEQDDAQMVTEGSTEAADGDTAPPTDEHTEPAADVQTAPPAVEDAAPPADEVTAPPADGQTAPPADGQTAPPADGQTAPPADEATEPAAVTVKSSPAPAQPPQLSSPSKWESKTSLREDVSLTKLARSFLELLLNADGSVDVREAARTLQSPKRRVYEVTNILMGVDLLRKESVNRVRWTGKCPISSFLWGKQKMQQESEKLKRVEDALDDLIKSCAQQLFSMTDDRDNANAAFVTFADVRNLPAFQDQTVIVVKAPEETKLEVPTPKEDSIQVHLKSGSGPISVLTCDSWLDVSGKILQAFRQIQHSHIKTRPLQTESSSSQSTALSV